MHIFTIKRFCLLITALVSLGLSAQDDAKTTYAYNTFEGTRVVVGHSVELLKEGEFDFLISHRFDPINNGIGDLFGLDGSIIRLGFDYAINDRINIGIGRSSETQLVDGFIKYGLIRQQKGAKNIPFSLTALATTGVSTVEENLSEPLSLTNRMLYSYQLIFARKFSDRFSLQIAPTLVHYNLVETRKLSNDVLVIGAAAKYQLSKAWSIKGEYFYALPDQLANENKNAFSLGFDFDTGSHVFQMHLSNAVGLVIPDVLQDTKSNWIEDKWEDGYIQFGFTISRVFKLKGRRY